MALCDQDKVSRRTPVGLLQRSAGFIAAHMVGGPLMDGLHTNVDKGLVLCLTEEGPYYVGREAVVARSDMRRVRNVYYDRGFANLFLREVLNT